MTAEFNITFSAADLIVRLSRLEQQVLNLANDRASDRFMLDTATGKIAGMTDRLTAAERNNESLTAYIQRVETDFTRALNRLDDQLNDYTGAFEQRLDKLEPLVKDCIAEALDASEKVDLLDERVENYADDVREMTRTSNIPASEPEPPVDTAWKPFNYLNDYNPDYERRVVVMFRTGEIMGPWYAHTLIWDENGGQTIVAWRYAKEGE